jgi:hypothetical protein
MSIWSRFMNAGWAGLQTGIQTARRVFEDPECATREQSYQQQAMAYRLLWSYYNNSMFDSTARWLNAATYKSNYNLYRNIRLIYNPVRRLVDFYAGQLYPGVLSEDGDELPDGVPLAIPFSDDTDPALKDAVAQFWQWSNWQSKKAVEVRYGAALGSVLVEVVDDIQRRKVTADIVWPGFLWDLDLDSAGNVKAYTLEYQAYDDDQHEAYTYRKEVDSQAFRYYRNGQEYDYGNGAASSNPYGFVPAIWIKHMDTGQDHGSPAIAGSLGKIDELNNLASHVHDQIHKVIGSPVVLWTDSPIQNLFNKAKRGATADFAEPAADQESVLMLKGGTGGRMDSLAGNLSLSDSATYMDRLIGEIEQDHPELALYRELRSMSQVTGPAAARLVGDVASRIVEAQAAYDQANIKLFQMAVAISGFRANSGAWGPLNRQQAKFTPFNLDSYERGDLDMAIMPRPLLTPTKLEQAQEKQAFWTGVGLAVQNAGVPVELVLRDEGWTDEQLAELGQSKVDQIQHDQMLAHEDVVQQQGQ